MDKKGKKKKLLKLTNGNIIKPQSIPTPDQNQRFTSRC